MFIKEIISQLLVYIKKRTLLNIKSLNIKDVNEPPGIFFCTFFARVTYIPEHVDMI